MRLVSKFYESNVFIVEKNNEVLIIDAGAKVEEVKKAVGNQKVVGILLTHGHFDHSYFVEEYMKEFGAKVYASEYIKEYLEEPKKNCSTDYEGCYLEVKDFSNFVLLSGEGKIKIGEFKVQYKQLGGHSRSDMCFKIDDEIYVGDTVLGRAVGRTDLYGGDKQAMVKSLKYLQGLNYSIMHCGHGEDFEKATQDKVCQIYIKFLSR